MLHERAAPAKHSLRSDRTDLEVQAVWNASGLTVEIMKSGACVHRLIVDDTKGPIEHRWLMDLLAREDHVDVNAMVREADDYVIGLDVNQG